MPRRKLKRAAVHAKLLRDAHKDGTYEQLYERAGGVCEICGKPSPTRRLDIDHNHRTLKIRGLLCRGCNMRLRAAMTVQWLYNAYKYMEAYG